MNTLTLSGKLRRVCALGATLVTGMLAFSSGLIHAQELTENVKSQIAALLAEKENRTPAQKKMSSSLIRLAREAQGQPMAAGVVLAIPASASMIMDNKNRVQVDITGTVSPALLNAITQSGGSILNSIPQFDAIRAWVAPGAIDGLAARADVRMIEPAEQAQSNVGAVTSEGDATHLAGAVRAAYGANGTGVTVGVLSDGVNSLAASIASGDLNASAAALAGQAGAGNEGTAMMEIVQDIVPNATVLFATGFSGQASMAANILALQAAGCQIIVDDVTYGNESPFQDGHATNSAGVISGAVNTVSAAGVLFFSSAANSGNLNDGTACTWEGDWNDSGVAAAAPLTTAGNLHSFGAANFNTVTTLGNSQNVNLFWADPLGGSSNDYDLFLTNAAGTVLKGFSNSSQSGTQNPFEAINGGGAGIAVGDRIYIVKTAGAAGRYLHLNNSRCRLSIATTGNTHGHNASGAANAFSVAAVPSNVASGGGQPTGPFPGAYTSAQLSETFTSDGPRRYFFNAAGTAFTPGNFSSTGGVVSNKPDFSAADGNVTTVAGFNPFFGTSSAAPHAAGIAALLLSYDPTLTAAQIRTALTSTAIDIEGAGWDPATGSGIIMAQAALASITPKGPALSALGSVLSGVGAPNGAGAGDGTVFDTLKRGGFLAENGNLVFPGTLQIGVGGVNATNFQGIWKGVGASITRLARSGNTAPESGGALFNILPDVPAINDDGQVTILASLVPGAGAPVTTVNNDTGLWSELGGTGFQILIRENDQIPGLAAGTLVGKFEDGCFATARINATQGEAAFTVTMKGASTDTALLRCSVVSSDTTAVSVVARENAAAPGVAGQTFGFLNSDYTDAARMDAQGNICFGAVLQPSGSTSLWYQPRGGALVKAVVAGDAAPGTTATFQSMDIPTMGSNGTYCFRGVLNLVGDNATNARNDGIWRGTAAGPFTNILRRGDTNALRAGLNLPSAAAKAGNIYSGWLGNGNRGAWLGWVDLAGDGISPYPADTFGIYTDLSGTMTLLISSGDPAPGIAGAAMFFIDHPVVGGADQAAFIGTVTGGGTTAGVNDKGIWRTAPSGGAPALVLRTGDSITTTAGVKTIADIDLPGSNLADHQWEQRVMDASGRIIVLVTFTDTTTSEVLVP